MLPDGRVVFLATQITRQGRSQVLLIDAERSGPNGVVGLKLERVRPPPKSSWLMGLLAHEEAPRQRVIDALALGPDEVVWVGGASNRHLDIASAPHSDAYLAKLDRGGNPLWERTYGNDGQKDIESIAAMPTGDVTVLGHDLSNGWLARIAADGRLVWERHLGKSGWNHDNVVASLPEGRLVVVGFEATNPGANKEDLNYLTAWILDGSGKELSRTRVGTFSSDIVTAFPSVAVTRDAVYIATSTSNPSTEKSVAIARVALDGRLLWSIALPDTALVATGKTPKWKSCRPTLAVLPNGDAMVACALDGQIHLYHLDKTSGDYQEMNVPLPACQAEHPAAVFLMVRDGATMVLSGTRPYGNVGPNCTWVGRLTTAR